jgi:DNA mismatch repair protein MutS
MSNKETPLMKQYNEIKGKYPDALLLFRVGDFYETFGEDAIKAANILGIILTARNNGGSKIELAGFPHHSLDTYLPKLVRAGQRVAICDQLEDPKLTKTIVKRGVTELVTPGVSFNDQVLEHKSNNFLAAIHFDKKQAGVAFLDISTGEFLTAEGSLNYIEKLVQGFSPKEMLYQKGKEQLFKDVFGTSFYTFKLDDWAFSKSFSEDILLRHFQTNSLKGFGVEQMPLGITAAGVILHYIQENQHDKLAHISKLSRIEEEKHVWLDRFTIRNLELLYPSSDAGSSLIEVLDKTSSPMGARLLKRWIALPLKSKLQIDDRLNAVEYFYKHSEINERLSKHLSQIGDLERLISKVAALRITPRELEQLGRSLQNIAPIKKALSESKNASLTKLSEFLHPCEGALNEILRVLHSDAPSIISKGQTIGAGVNAELDDLRNITQNGKNYLLEIQKRETELTGISSLKIAFNNVFGYYIEVRNTHKDKVPSTWIRKQTLTQAERYITEELKEYETKILGAEEKIHHLETKLFNDLVLHVSDYISQIQTNAHVFAQIDCLVSFANVAKENNYNKPEISEEKDIVITQGRHPVIEKKLAVGELYVPNDVELSDDQQIIMITGPNMSGKSAILRQTALIVLMAQMGSFVPAQGAKIGLVDKVFTRVGASDNISSGESTFMVEMNETASILNNLSDRSLILLDEIGRGTSTYDGISIAWAITEYLHEHPQYKAKTLFATHYHELNDMASIFPRIKNYNVSVKEMGNKVIFMRKLVAGGSAHSFGIHVAKMAGMPRFVLDRANDVLKTLERSHAMGSSKANGKKDKMQLSFFQLDDPVLQNIRHEIEHIDINTLTPVEALMKLNEIKKMVGG